MQGITFEYGDVPSTAHYLWKLHESCNFIPDSIKATSGMTFAPGVTWNPSLTVLSPSAAEAFSMSNTGLYPAMALFDPQKHVQIGAETISAIQDRWKREVASAQKVVVIGVRPNPGDPHIWASLATTSAELLFVGNEGSFNAWVSQYRPGGPSRFLGSRFTSSIPIILSNL